MSRANVCIERWVIPASEQFLQHRKVAWTERGFGSEFFLIFLSVALWIIWLQNFDLADCKTLNMKVRLIDFLVWSCIEDYGAKNISSNNCCGNADVRGVEVHEKTGPAVSNSSPSEEGAGCGISSASNDSRSDLKESPVTQPLALKKSSSARNDCMIDLKESPNTQPSALKKSEGNCVY